MMDRRSLIAAFCLVLFTAATAARADAVKVELKRAGDGYTLLRDGRPYFVQGAGGDASKQLLKDCGGNSFRTWGVGDDTAAKLDEAQKLGLTVTVGIWLGHEQHHFDYADPAAVRKQFDAAKAAVLKYKDSPALLVWAVGNEMEGYKDGGDPKVWAAVQDIARMIHEVDPNHPTMTVVAEIGGQRVPAINRYCPDVDIVGINSYGGGPSLAARYRAAGGVKPFVVTEFGPPGAWEVGKNGWDAPHEPTSTEKADQYRATYERSIAAERGKLCLGSYVFAWGAKQEATATWFGLFLADGTRLEPIDTMAKLWSGHDPANRCPRVQPLRVDGPDKVAAGETVRVKLAATDPENDPLTVKWFLKKDMAKYDTGGDAVPEPPDYSVAIVHGDAAGAEVKMPSDGGGYWLYAYVYDNHGGAAVADVPLFVTGGAESTPKAPPAKLPLVLYEDHQPGVPYVWSGWMGQTADLAMDEKCPTNPHSGDTCMKCQFKAATGFGGIVWQNPADNWGTQLGGYDLTGAKRLTFWARGEAGDERVTFRVGILGADKKYHDSAVVELPDVFLTKDWKQYDIDLAGKDLSRIVTGFGWSVATAGKPVTFYLDDVRFDAEAPSTANKGTAAGGASATLPFALYEDGLRDLPYVGAGWMGDAGSIAVDDKSADNPHAGATCMKCEFKKADGWGGVVWQSPANDWGDQPGGYNLTGAKRLTFWARGADGGEKVDFKFGLLGHDRKFADTGSGATSETLTKEWKQYTIDVAGKDLSRVKTGFAWVVAGQGHPVVFYLDDVRFE